VTAIDYEVEYNNRARVPENPALMAGWARDSAAYRAQHPPRRLTYGPGSRNVIDLFEGGTAGHSSFTSMAATGRRLTGRPRATAPAASMATASAWRCRATTSAPMSRSPDIIGQMRAATCELAKLGRRW